MTTPLFVAIIACLIWLGCSVPQEKKHWLISWLADAARIVFAVAAFWTVASLTNKSLL